MVASTPSSWRPPWLETMMPSMPCRGDLGIVLDHDTLEDEGESGLVS